MGAMACKRGLLKLQLGEELAGGKGRRLRSRQSWVQAALGCIVQQTQQMLLGKPGWQGSWQDDALADD